MKHRIRSCAARDGLGRAHVFVEVAPDEFMEVSVDARDLTPANVAEFIAKVKEDEKPNEDGLRIIHVTYAARAFDIGIVESWIEHTPIETDIES